MQAQQLIHSANFTIEERKFLAKLNQVQTLSDQAELCATSCLQNSIGLKQIGDSHFCLKANLEAEEKLLFNEKETICLDNCVFKVFATEKVMRAYLPTRLMSLRLTQSEITHRLNTPNEERGPYFLRKEYEDT